MQVFYGKQYPIGVENVEYIDDYIHFHNHERIRTKNRSGIAYALPLRLKLTISYLGVFLCCSHNPGLFKSGIAFCL